MSSSQALEGATRCGSPVGRRTDMAWIISDVRSLPVGCGTWPSLWSNANAYSWPSGGEIDIIEGANDSGAISSLHTGWRCWMNETSMAQTGTLTARECTSAPEHKEGGGVHVMERTDRWVKIWFWPRNDPSLPYEIQNAIDSARLLEPKHESAPRSKHNAPDYELESESDKSESESFPVINPKTWGAPYTNFGQGDRCDMSKFQDQNIIINLTFCGDWAEGTYPKECPKTCISHVDEDPAAFAKAYWDIASVTVWKPTTKREKEEISSNRPTKYDHVVKEQPSEWWQGGEEYYSAPGRNESPVEELLDWF
ncbi:hypothetical protein FRB95_003596 [Tulasnella sp. JGI-2019a]|nr:hypothetical protein FRB95_003596 [Tulasnella sp. JGI-2019a]